MTRVPWDCRSRMMIVREARIGLRQGRCGCWRRFPVGDYQANTPVEKIRSLPLERVAEVEDFVDFLRQRDENRRLVEAATRLSEEAFAAVWDNPDDADY